MNGRHTLNRMILRCSRPAVLVHRALLEQVMAMPPAARTRWQTARLRELVRHWLQVPAYRELCTEGMATDPIAEVGDLARLPVIGKQEITARFASWRDQAPRAVVNSTSGSSGTNFRFLQDGEMRAANSAAVHWAYAQLGVDYWSDRRLVIWGHSPALGWRSELTERLKVWCLNARTLQAFGLDTRRCDEYLCIMRRWRPRVVEGYPTYLEALARRARETGFAWDSPPAVLVSSGEQLQPHQRAEIEAVFGIPVADRYGSREFGVIGQARPGQDHALVPPTRFLIETTADGEMLITDLQNRATPFIRYACGDLGLVEDRVQAGAAQVIRQLGGRVHDRIETTGGRLIPGQYWTLLSRSVGGIEEFQVRQRRGGRIEFLIPRDATITERAVAAVEQRVRQEYPDLPGFTVVRVDRFERTALGKRKFVIREAGHGD